MKITVGQKYKLNAPWHSDNNKIVEVIQKRKGVSEDFKGKSIYHIAMNPNSSTRIEDFDEEFLSKHFRSMEDGLEKGSIDEYLDEKGQENVKKLESSGIAVTLWTDDSGSHYVKVEGNGVVDYIRVEDYDDNSRKERSMNMQQSEMSEQTIPESSETEEISGPPLPSVARAPQGPPNPNMRNEETKKSNKK